MRIAMVAPLFGTEKAIANYSKNLVKGLEKSKTDVDLLTFSAGKPLTIFKQLKKISKYDIIHIQHEYNLLGYLGIPFFFVYLYFKFFKKGKLITTLHTIHSKKTRFQESKLKTIFRKILYSTQNKLIGNISNHIIIHSNFFIEVLKEYNFNEKEMSVIPQGIISKVSLTDKEIAKKELGIKGHCYLIIGTPHPDHQADVILNQADKIGKTIVLATNPKADSYRGQKKMDCWLNYLKKIVLEKGFEKYVRFDFKEIPYPLWWKYFSAADIILLPYRKGIASGIITDAISCKRPSVVSNTLFFEDMEKKYKCVKIAKSEKDYAQAIRDVMKPSKYKKMQKECERYLKENSWENLAKKYRKIYEMLLK